MTSIERNQAPNPHSIAARDIPLIDRTEEMRVLREAVDRAVAEEGGLVFLYGEAGIGKTRLARELGAYAHSRGMLVLTGRCPTLFRMDGVPPYVLWREVIRDYLENSSLEQLYRIIGFYPAEVAKLVPELVQKLRAMPQSFPISPEQEQNRLFEAISQFITNIARESPLLVVLDDLQWTDASSILLLHYLARGVQKTPLLLLGAYRSTDIDAKHALTQVLAQLKRECSPQSVSLKRMSLEDTSEMIERILEQGGIPPEFCQKVYEKTRGNPFFTKEVIESLKEDEVIYRQDNKWKIKEVSEIEFPQTIKNVIEERIGRLDDDCQNVLMMASFIGNDFTFEALQGVTGLNEDKLRKIVDGLLKTGLLKHRDVRGEVVCSFADLLVRNVVNEEVGTFERKKLHGVVGRALEKAYAAKIDEHLGELAFHFLEGEDKEKALDYFLKAGDKATKIYANTEAASYLQCALKLLEDKGETRERARVLEQLGDVKGLVAEYDLCLKRWNEALLLWKQLDEKEKLAGLHRKMAAAYWRDVGNIEQARLHFDEALKILEAKPESVDLAALYAARATMSVFNEDATSARYWIEKTLALAKRLNASEALASAYVDTGLVFDSIEGEKEKAVECYEKALKIALDNGYAVVACRAYVDLANVLPAGENERRLDCYEKGFELSKKIGAIDIMSLFGSYLAMVHLGKGDVDKALTLLEQSESLDRKTANLFNLSTSTRILGGLYEVLGEPNRGEQYLEESLSIVKKTKNDFFIPVAYRAIGDVYYGRGEFAKAKGFFDEMTKLNEKRGLEAVQFYSFFSRVSQLPTPVLNDIALGEIDKAKNVLDKLRKFAYEKQNKHLIAGEDATRAMLLFAEKKWTESIDLFEKSVQEYEALDARKWNVHELANILYAYARVCLERNQGGDREKADRLLSQALEIFQKMGARKEIEKTMKLMDVLQPPETQIGEKAIGPAAYVCDDLRSNIVATPTELKTGESLELEIEVTNTRKEATILLTKIMEIIPEGFSIVKKPESYRVEGNCLNMKEKQLDPMKKEEVKLVLIPKIQGTFKIQPKIVYFDESGNEKTCQPKPLSITVKELGIKGWLKGER